MKSLYGAWITKNELIPVPEESHWETGMDYLAKRYNLPPDKMTRKYSVYMVMFRLGFVRVVFKDTGEIASTEFWQRAKLTRYQRDYINAANNNYPIPLTKMY